MSNELSLSDFPQEIQKSFSNNDLEKGTYSNNAQNRKLGRVGKEYGGGGKENGESKKVWTDEQESEVKKLDASFEAHLKNKNIEQGSYEASQEWSNSGFKGKMKEIFGKKSDAASMVLQTMDS
jgi:hypothetical protein